MGAKEVLSDTGIVKVSLVGIGMRSHAGVAARMFEVLYHEGVNIEMISTTEIKISVVIREGELEKAVRSLHAAFDLE
jgi:aspartate kinase